MFQFEGSTDNKNYGRKETGHYQRVLMVEEESYSVSTSNSASSPYRESS